MYTRTFNVTEQNRMLDELYDAVADSVTIPDEDVWPGILRDLDPQDALWWLLAEVDKSGQHIDPPLSDRILAALPDFADMGALRPSSSAA
ncbi:MAG: hypothetical protein QM662_14770 [Gordonia sp. (in: high G+C Gram-positive bacteria)]